MIFTVNLTLKPKFTKRDSDILTILWDSGQPMTASQIAATAPDLTINTVQAVLRKLLKNNLVQVADIVYSGTVLTRSYVPIVTIEEFAAAQLQQDYQKFSKKVSKASIFAALLDSETDLRKELQELEQLLENYKKEIEHKTPEDN